MDKPLSPDQVLDKMAKFCAYQERCVKDVTEKLKTFDISPKDEEEILNYLIDNRFVNDERFAKAFVRGKVNQSGWGLNKIRFHLIQKGIDKTLDEAVVAFFETMEWRPAVYVLKDGMAMPFDCRCVLKIHFPIDIEPIPLEGEPAILIED